MPETNNGGMPMTPPTGGEKERLTPNFSSPLSSSPSPAPLGGLSSANNMNGSEPAKSPFTTPMPEPKPASVPPAPSPVSPAPQRPPVNPPTVGSTSPASSPTPNLSPRPSYNFPPASSTGPITGGAGEPKAPVSPITSSEPAPATGGETTIRTMGADLSSVRSSGGFVSGAPSADGSLTGKSNAAVPTEKPVNLSSFSDISGAPVFTPGQPTSVASKEVSPKLLWIIVGVIAVLAILAIVYATVIMPKKTSPITTPAAVTTSTPSAPATTTPVLPQAPAHQSYLVLSSSTTSTPLTLANLDLSSLNSALGQVKFSGTSTAFSAFSLNFENNPVDPAELMSVILPDASSTIFGTDFQKDVTGFLYYDGSGDVLPGYVFKLNASSTPAGTEKAVSGAIESSTDIANFYLVSPGAKSKTGFLNGTLPNGNKTRFVRMGNQGFVFEYGWSGNYLVLSSSYKAIIEAESLLSPATP